MNKFYSVANFTTGEARGEIILDNDVLAIHYLQAFLAGRKDLKLLVEKSLFDSWTLNFTEEESDRTMLIFNVVDKGIIMVPYAEYTYANLSDIYPTAIVLERLRKNKLLLSTVNIVKDDINIDDYYFTKLKKDEIKSIIDTKYGEGIEPLPLIINLKNINPEDTIIAYDELGKKSVGYKRLDIRRV